MSLNNGKYDEMLESILVKEESILGFLSAIFNFLARRTDFYFIRKGPHEGIGLPPGVAEELVLKILRACDPKNWKPPNEMEPTDVNDEIMCSTVAQEVEVIADEVEAIEMSSAETEEKNDNQHDTEGTENPEMQDTALKSAPVMESAAVMESVPVMESAAEMDSAPLMESAPLKESTPQMKSAEVIESAPQKILTDPVEPSVSPNEDEPEPSSSRRMPRLKPMQKNSEAYNGAEREKYSWAQTIMDLDVTVKLPPEIKSSKDIKVTINPNDLSVVLNQGRTVMIKDTLLYKIKPSESFWTITGGKLLIHLEKAVERWWKKLLMSEEEINLSKIDCSRDLYDLPDDHIQKVREMQWNQEQKLKGLPTSDQLRNIEILKKAWDVEGSPFKGQKFDPSVLQTQLNM